MVFFTCNHCGESLKKPAVEKHYTWKSCKNAPPFLTCVDCLKDFRGDEFRAHTKCITEDEKYSAKGFVAKPEKNKGAQKQEAWTEIIANHLTERKDLDEFTRRTLDSVANQTNVPRKKAKFINFIRNSMYMNPHNAEKIWSVVEQALAEFNKKADAAKAEAAAKRKIAEDERLAAKAAAAEAKAAAAAAEAGEEVPAAGKKEKKSKKSKSKAAAADENEVTSTTVEAEAATENGAAAAADGGKKKAKKDKKRKADATEESAEVTTNGAAKKAKTVGDDSEAAGGFEWKKEITAVLQKKSDIKLEKLRKKVLKRLAEVTGAGETTAKDEKKFQKHLDKLSKYVSVEGDNVKLLVTE